MNHTKTANPTIRIAVGEDTFKKHKIEDDLAIVNIVTAIRQKMHDIYGCIILIAVIRYTPNEPVQTNHGSPEEIWETFNRLLKETVEGERQDAPIHP